MQPIRIQNPSEDSLQEGRFSPLWESAREGEVVPEDGEEGSAGGKGLGLVGQETGDQRGQVPGQGNCSRGRVGCRHRLRGVGRR